MAVDAQLEKNNTFINMFGTKLPRNEIFSAHLTPMDNCTKNSSICLVQMDDHYVSPMTGFTKFRFEDITQNPEKSDQWDA